MALSPDKDLQVGPLDKRSNPHRGLLVIVGASATVEAFAVALGPLWVAITVVGLDCGGLRISRRELLLERDVRLSPRASVFSLDVLRLFSFGKVTR